MSITHTFVSAVADGGDATKVRPQSNWNAVHTITDTAAGIYLRLGSTSPPTNTTSGDFTGVRAFIPNIYGSITNASAGTLTLSSTTDATKGHVYLGSAAKFDFDEANGVLGIGASPDSSYKLILGSPVDVNTLLRVDSSGTASSFVALSSSGGGISLHVDSAGIGYLDVTGVVTGVIVIKKVSAAANTIVLDAGRTGFGTTTLNANTRLTIAKGTTYYIEFDTDDATDPTGSGGAATGRIPIRIGGATHYLAYY